MTAPRMVDAMGRLVPVGPGQNIMALAFALSLTAGDDFGKREPTQVGLHESGASYLRGGLSKRARRRRAGKASGR